MIALNFRRNGARRIASTLSIWSRISSPAQASKTPATREIVLLEPMGGEAWLTDTHTIRWDTQGTAWTGSETVKLEYSDDDGASWNDIHLTVAE